MGFNINSGNTCDNVDGYVYFMRSAVFVVYDTSQRW